MTIYGLIGTQNRTANINPGCHYITDGIRWLIRRIDPTAQFLPIEMLEDDPAGWDVALSQTDILLLCGNPRFNLDKRGVYWDQDIWRRIVQATDAGIPFIDAWAGAAHPFPLCDDQEMVDAIAAIPKTKMILAHESRAALCIARDRITAQLLEGHNDNTVLLPCSAWYACAEYGVAPAPKDCHCIALRMMPGYPWIIDRALAIQAALERELPTYIVAHLPEDYWWIKARRDVPNLLCLPDATSLLRFYARVDKLLSFRIHASIPALSLGTQVCNVSIDSRSLTVGEFGIESIPFTDLSDPEFLPPYTGCKVIPETQATLDVLKAAFERVL